MCPGVCKDSLADAFARFGRVPIEKRRIAVSRDHPISESRKSRTGPREGSSMMAIDVSSWSAIRRNPGWGEAWVTPAGRLEEGETTVDGLRREVREEVGLDVLDPMLTRILQQTLEDGSRARHGYFARFIAARSAWTSDRVKGSSRRKWFDHLPQNLAFREDYLRDFEQIPRAVSF